MIPTHPEFPPRPSPGPPLALSLPPRGPARVPASSHRARNAPRLTTQTSPPFRHATRDSTQWPRSPVAPKSSGPKPSWLARPAPRPTCPILTADPSRPRSGGNLLRPRGLAKSMNGPLYQLEGIWLNPASVRAPRRAGWGSWRHTRCDPRRRRCRPGGCVVAFPMIVKGLLLHAVVKPSRSWNGPARREPGEAAGTGGAAGRASRAGAWPRVPRWRRTSGSPIQWLTSGSRRGGGGTWAWDAGYEAGSGRLRRPYVSAWRCRSERAQVLTRTASRPGTNCAATRSATSLRCCSPGWAAWPGAEVKSRPFGVSYWTVRWAGSGGYEPGPGRGGACMATLELRILRRFAWSCG